MVPRFASTRMRDHVPRSLALLWANTRCMLPWGYFNANFNFNSPPHAGARPGQACQPSPFATLPQTHLTQAAQGEHRSNTNSATLLLGPTNHKSLLRPTWIRRSTPSFNFMAFKMVKILSKNRHRWRLASGQQNIVMLPQFLNYRFIATIADLHLVKDTTFKILWRQEFIPLSQNRSAV